MLAKYRGFKTEKYPDWSHTMTPDVHHHRSTTLGQKRFSPLRQRLRTGSEARILSEQRLQFYSVASFHPLETGFPHSRQNAFERDVINPQDGHILCDPKPAICGFSLIKRADALKFLNERVTKVGRV
jgi:hypothetical protein